MPFDKAHQTACSYLLNCAASHHSSHQDTVIIKSMMIFYIIVEKPLINQDFFIQLEREELGNARINAL